MFNLTYLNREVTETKHQNWCRSKTSFFSDVNSQTNNRYISWLHSLGERTLLSSPEDMLCQLDSLFGLISGAVTLNASLFNSLSRPGFLFWDVSKIQGVTQFCFNFQWSNNTSYLRMRALLKNNACASNTRELAAIIRGLNLSTEFDSLLDEADGIHLKHRLVKFFNPSGGIKIPVEFFMDMNELNEFLQFSTDTFVYDELIPRQGSWNAYELIKTIGNSVCPYCNRSFTHSVMSKEIGFNRPELDHFLPKSIFPFFATSLYNLIPVCHTCNHAKSNNHVVSNFGGHFVYTLLHPNIQGDSVEAIDVFCTKNEGDLIEYILDSSASLSGKLTLSASARANEKLINSFIAFNLALINSDNDLIGLYGYHHKDIERLLDIIRRYPSEAIKSIAELIDSSREQLQKTLVDLLLPDDPVNEPLGKLKSDMLKDIVESWDRRSAINWANDV